MIETILFLKTGPTKTFALPDSLGVTVVNDPEKSISKESLNDGLKDFNIGIGITDFFDSTSVGTAVTFFSEFDHGLNRATKVSISGLELDMVTVLLEHSTVQDL